MTTCWSSAAAGKFPGGTSDVSPDAVPPVSGFSVSPELPEVPVPPVPFTVTGVLSTLGV